MEQTRIYLPSSSKFKTKVLKENHDSPTIAHVGFFKTYYNSFQSFFWKRMEIDIHKYVVGCDTFQWQKFETNAHLGLLQPLHILTHKWYEISMEFITGLPTLEGKDSILVIIDRLTKYAHFIWVSSKEKAIKVTYSYVKNIFKLLGFPKVIVGDRDPKFTNNF